MRDTCLVFLGDIKGTKSALESFHAGGREVLEQRLEHLHDASAQCFLKYRARSRSMRLFTVSDSVVGVWTDPIEGRRLAAEFAEDLWSRLDPSVVAFRGFFDVGPMASESSALAEAATRSDGRFVRVFSTGIAVWSVAVAEAAHLPTGIYFSRTLTKHFSSDSFAPQPFVVGPFEFLRTTFSQQTVQKRG